MHVQMRDGFARIRTVVHNEPEAAAEGKFFGKDPRREEEMADDELIIGRCGFNPGNWFFGNEQKVHRRLRLNIMNDDAELVFVFDLRGNFASNDSFENGLSHQAIETQKAVESRR